MHRAPRSCCESDFYMRVERCSSSGHIPPLGPTIASKLFARKRPRLRPIYDTVVAGVTDTRERQWEPLHQALRANRAALHHRLQGIREAAGLPRSISALRILDVIAWMDGRVGSAARFG